MVKLAAFTEETGQPLRFTRSGALKIARTERDAGQLAREVGDQATIGKVNVDEHPALAARFGIQAIPQLLFFKDGAEKDRIVGAAPKREIVKRLQGLAG